MNLSLVSNRNTKIFLLIFLTVIAIVGIAFVPRIPQQQSFHHFADQRNLYAIPGCLNVVSNAGFMLVGLAGIISALANHVNARLRLMYLVLFTGILLTACGSGYYHWAPDNNRLVYDRLPMVIVFMAFLAIVIAEWINLTAGYRLLPLLLTAGILSVIWWQHTENAGNGDLRFYMLVQFYPMILIPLILLLFYKQSRNVGLLQMGYIIAWYIVAKILERYDDLLFHKIKLISGHSLKHIAAAVATWYMVTFFRIRHIKSPGN
ncbi:ceramidase [Filimonas effusa]|nr:ceramidase [Filimonas effusa]